MRIFVMLALLCGVFLTACKDKKQPLTEQKVEVVEEKKVEVEKVVKDYIKIEYRDGGNLYIPATGLDLIQKYASSDAKAPKLNKLGSKEWSKTKTKVKGAVNEVAKELVIKKVDVVK